MAAMVCSHAGIQAIDQLHCLSDPEKAPNVLHGLSRCCYRNVYPHYTETNVNVLCGNIVGAQQCFRDAVREDCGQPVEEFLSRIAWEYCGYGILHSVECGSATVV
ncbi:uncharacterized protein LOC131943080 [Physella acuta]|uniref:uncharacterized protein LOC131943080 n=1 Tax=Physella acuta TaxID=109671 RepID=UPI0027DBA80C|nr:uncharacterized protein LOC131943080 [Physella acuta]